MFPLYLHEYKITIWWSAKCGCSTIKNLCYNKILNLEKKNLHTDSYNAFDPKLLHYKNILIVRNPIFRFISSYNMFFNTFIDMHKINKDLTFKEFVELNLKYRIDGLKNNVSLNHHTTNQFSEQYINLNKYCLENNIEFKFDEVIKLESFDAVKFTKIYFNIDLKNEEILNKSIKNNNKEYVFDKTYNEIQKIKPEYNFYLNEEIIHFIKEIYKDDYKLLEEYNIFYDDIYTGNTGTTESTSNIETTGHTCNTETTGHTCYTESTANTETTGHTHVILNL